MMTIPACPWETSKFLFVSSNVPDLVYYSHIVSVSVALAIGILIFRNNTNGALNRLFLAFVSFFSLWVVLDLILWATNRPETVMFAWSLQLLLEPLTYVTAFYLFYFYVKRSIPSFRINILIFIFLLPLILLLPTDYALQSLYIADCEAIEGLIGKFYTHTVNITILFTILFVATRNIPRMSSRAEKMSATYFAIGLVVFLLSFSSGVLVGSLTDEWVISQYGLFAMPFFTGMISYSIFKFRAFNVKIFVAQFLVFTLSLATLSLITLQNIRNVRIVATLTFVLVAVLGYVLVRSVRREVEQREHIQVLADNLKVANEKLKELDKLKSQFLSIATHELRTPLTIVRNFVSLMMDGSYGKVPPAAEEAGRQVFERVNDMARSVDTYLNVSRIEQGKISYTFADTDFSRIVQLAVEGLKANAEKKRLELSLTVSAGAESLHGNYDGPKLTEVVVNLLDNSIKYTPSGSVRVSLEKVGGYARLTIRDTGVGMSEKTKANLFKLFSPGEDAKKVNPASTGVGLYVSMAHVLAHKGTLTAQSEGVGKGSTFTLDLPLTKQ